MKLGLKAASVAALAAAAFSASAQAQQVIAQDLVVRGSICVGLDCSNGESFGFDTLRLKENNLRIRFDDTSNTASFPNRDWQITANDTTNGGRNMFAIDDLTGGRTPFLIEAGAPTSSLYVDDGGRVGFGTAAPVVEAHIVNGDTPTLRLQQDGSSGFTQQTWDVAGNETNFFVRDVTNASRLPFRIKPGAPQNALFIDSDGDIGFGTQSPGSAMHMFASDDNAQLHIENTEANQGLLDLLQLTNNGDPAIRFVNTGKNENWRARAGTRFILDAESTAGFEFEFFNDGNMTIAGTLTTGGTTCGGGCDFVFDEDFQLPSIGDRAEIMWANGYLPNMGPTIEGEPFNLTEMVGRMLHEIEIAHIYIAQLHDRIEELEAEETSEG